MSPIVPPNRTESDATPGWRKWAESFAAAVGWSFLFGFVYLFVNIAIGIGSVSELRSMIRTDDWSDESLALLMMIFGFSFACIFGVYGYFAAKAAGRRLLFHLATALPLTLLGIVIWVLSDRGVKGLQAEFGGASWFLYMVFAYWATPLFEYARHYVPGSLMKYAALSASFVPGLAAVSGAWLHLAFREPRLRKRMLAAVSPLPCLLLASLAVSLILPRSTLFTAETYPKVDGATAAIPFGKVLARELAGLNRPRTERFVIFNTTHNAYVNLITKKADIIFAAGPSDEEMGLAEQNGVKLKLTPIGKDAFIFLVNRNNKVDNLTVAQIRDIYAGKVTNWQEVGGEDAPIIAFQRDKNSGSQTFMESKVMQGLGMAAAPMGKKITGMGNLIDSIAEYDNAENAIGYSFYYFASEMHKRESVKFLSVEGIPCNKETIRSGSYPFTAILYAVTREDEPAGSPANRLLNWILSEEGSRAVEQGGFIPINSPPKVKPSFEADSEYWQIFDSFYQRMDVRMIIISENAESFQVPFEFPALIVHNLPSVLQIELFSPLDHVAR